MSSLCNASEGNDNAPVASVGEIIDIDFVRDAEDNDDENDDQQTALKKLFYDCYRSNDATACQHVIALMSYKIADEKNAAGKIISSQQETIASQQNTIKSLSSTVDTYNEIEKRRTERIMSRRAKRATDLKQR